MTQAPSKRIVIDNTPPRQGRVLVGKATLETFVPGEELPVRWEGIEDKESGINLLAVRHKLFSLL